MTERAVYFGRNNNLLGILNTPEPSSPDSPAVVLLNAGLLHRVGPNRMNVELARRLSAKGVFSLRFDMSGIGDSEIVDPSLLYFERAVRDVRDAMDALENLTGITDFIVIGLCTGAFNAFGAARQDSRVRGIVLLDGYSYPTVRSQVRRYSSRLFRPEKLWEAVRRLIDPRTRARERATDMTVFRNEEMPKHRFALELSSLLERNVRLMLVYTGLGPLSYTYDRQLQEAFPEIPIDEEVTVVFYPEADHTFTVRANREQLLVDIQAWLSSEFMERAS